jgi:heat shock protein HslJ
MIGVAVFICVFVGVYMVLKVFGKNDAESLPPTMTAKPTLTIVVQPTQTLLPTATRVVATAIPGLTSVSPTVIPSITPTAKSSQTSSPTVKPSATVVSPTPSATHVPPTPSATHVAPTATPKPSATIPPTPTPNPVQNIIWRWLTVTQLSTDVETNVAGTYTISFYPDGTLSGVADCNTFSGTYSQSNGFKIRIGATTSTFCGDGSLDTEYLQLLGEVVSGGPDGLGNLALETAGGAQRMVFANGGAAVKP